MLNKLNELRKGKEEGFTLIELLVVILIIGVLSAIALPIFLNQQKESLKAGVKSDVRNSVTNVATWIVSNPSTAIPAITFDNSTGTATQPAADAIKLVASKGDKVIVAPGTNTGDYTVTGSNTAISATYAYAFDSSTGQYKETN